MSNMAAYSKYMHTAVSYLVYVLITHIRRFIFILRTFTHCIFTPQMQAFMCITNVYVPVCKLYIGVYILFEICHVFNTAVSIFTSSDSISTNDIICSQNIQSFI